MDPDATTILIPGLASGELINVTAGQPPVLMEQGIAELMGAAHLLSTPTVKATSFLRSTDLTIDMDLGFVSSHVDCLSDDDDCGAEVPGTQGDAYVVEGEYEDDEEMDRVTATYSGMRLPTKRHFELRRIEYTIAFQKKRQTTCEPFFPFSFRPLTRAAGGLRALSCTSPWCRTTPPPTSAPSSTTLSAR